MIIYFPTGEITLLDIVAKHSFIIGIYWIAFSIAVFGFALCEDEKKIRFDIYGFVLMVLGVLSVVLFILILI